ncbi:synergin gamma-like isoform X2 [Saccostrea echinata]|uniref:synergin gamma-like isoform X2 n=1 Tax=Saccostrea echinata TaxID=191078 RepID=UPI002A82DF61|nr:synergin gamma-like isoform X2 [Saccostrea echinata]
MNENRNAQFPGQPPGNFGMMSSHPGYVQPGMTGFPMMQQQRMMGPQTPMMQQQMLMSNRGPMIQGNMFPMQMGMRPGVGPPSYNQALTDSYRQRGPTPSRGPTPARNRAPLSPESQRRALEQEKRARQFQEQQQRLKNFRGGSKVDADSLIESMFGKSEKPTPKNSPAPPTAKEATNAQQTDDGFGDFLGGPSTPAGQEGSNDNQNVNNLEATPTTNEQLSAPPTENIPPKEEKKDLMAMMFECSDLSAPNKAKTFHKPSLKELPPTHHHHHTFQQSRHAHQWKQEEDLTGLFIVQEPATVSAPPTSPPPTAQAPPTPVKFEVPAWCHEDDKVPHLYRQVLEAATVDGKISTDRLYPILVLSGLPKETLGQIWSLANQSTPGQLIKPELYLILALIAFAQNNITSLSPEMLRKCPQPPVPFLGQQATPPPQPASTSELPPQNNAAVVNSGISGTLPMIQGSQTPLTAGNSGTIGTLPTVTGIQTSMVTGSPSSPGSQPVSSQGVPGVGMPGFSGLEGSRAGKTEDDDFADFQEAPAFTSTATSPKKSNKLKKEPEYLYSVPKPEDLQIQMSPDMNHSNISNFFGSDDSSEEDLLSNGRPWRSYSVSASPQRKIVTGKKGASTPNSMDEDFDDFKSADSKPSDSSQFTSSEQSENEDFKVLESYLDDFNRKKSEQEKQQDSPLHRPLPKFTSPQSSQLPSNATLSAIPAARNLWSKPPTVKKEAAKPQSDLPRAHFGLSPPESSDSDFADFQGAPSEKPPAPSQPQGADLLKASQSDTCLIGDEDKYAALRAFEVSEDTSVTVAPSIFDSKATAESEEDSWADFQAVSTDAKVDEIKQINDQSDVLQTNFTSNTQNDWSSFSSSANVTSKDDSDWSAFGNGTEATNIPKDDWSSFSQGEVGNDQQKDDWSNFSQGEVTKDEAKDEWASFHSSTGSNDTIKNTNQAPQLVEVKKQHLQTKDILGLFKVKENPVSVVSRDDFVEPEREKIPPAPTNIPLQKSKKLSSDSDMDDDHFRAPPPMDYVDEEDDTFGDFSRGYDLDEVVNKPAAQDEKKKNLYNFYGMDAPSSKSISQGLANKAQTSVLDPTETDSSSVSGNVSGFPSNPAISEDSMSTSSLELPGLKGRVPVVKDMDSQSISSNEFGNFETHQKKTFNPESKSLDSLDLKKEEVESVENLEMPENEVKDENVPEQKEHFSQFSEPVLPFVSKVAEPLPVLGDRYSCLMEDIPGSDKHVHEWQKCLESCYKVVKDANTVFNSISSSAVCNEVITSEQGSEFVKGVVEIYRVVCRINVSIESTGLTNEKLKQLLKDIDLAWNNLAAFLVGGNMMPDDKDLDCKNGILKSDDQVAQFQACGVCLLDVDATCKDFGSEEQCAKLTYGGRQYHAVCANLWVNLVDSMLPALRLPELL